MTGRKHTAFFVIIAVLLCLAVLGSFLFVAVNAVHDCTHDDDCAVCRIIDAYVHSTRFEFSAAAVVMLFLLTFAVAAVAWYHTAFLTHTTTLIKLRTELRN